MTTECYQWKEIEKLRVASKGGNKDDEAGLGKTLGSLHTFTDIANKREKKLLVRAVNATLPDVPQWLNWSEQPLLWSREDHLP